MGRGPKWLDAENHALIDCWLVGANDNIRGTDQSGKVFWERVLKDWLGALQGVSEGRAAREARGYEALRKQWSKVMSGVMEFASFYVKAKSMKPTGNVSHEDLVNVAVSLYCGESVYARIRGDYADDAKNNKTTKRRPKRVACPWLQY